MEPNLEKEQHFLVDKKILKLEIKEARLNKKDRIIEIGAGSGVLTKEIVKYAGEVLAFEIDERFKEDLKKIKGVEFIIGNALKYDWRGYNKIVSNLPYSLSEPVIMKSVWDRVEELVLIVGENFKKILCSKESKVGIIAGLNYDIKPIIKVNKKSFNPEPRVDSWMVKLKKKKSKKIEETLKRIIFRNGKIKNSVVYSLVEEGFTKKQAKKILEKMEINEMTLEKPVASITGRFILILKRKLEEFL